MRPVFPGRSGAAFTRLAASILAEVAAHRLLPAVQARRAISLIENAYRLDLSAALRDAVVRSDAARKELDDVERSVL